MSSTELSVTESLSPPGSIVHRIESIVDRFDLAAMFPSPQPLEVELGSGDGSFLARYTQAHPERNFIGVERLLGRLRKLDRKSRRLKLTNIRGVRIESAYLVEYLLPKNSASAIHVYFPDPWPKRKHRRNRIINARFTEIAHDALAPGGIVYLRTDHVEYFSQMVEVFAANPAFTPVETPEELSSVLTDFEKTFHARGISTQRAAYRRGA